MKAFGIRQREGIACLAMTRSKIRLNRKMMRDTIGRQEIKIQKFPNCYGKQTQRE